MGLRRAIRFCLFTVFAVCPLIVCVSRGSDAAKVDPSKRMSGFEGKVLHPSVMHPSSDGLFQGKVLQFPTIDATKVITPDTEKAPIRVVAINTGKPRPFQTRSLPVIKAKMAPQNGRMAVIPHLDRVSFASMLKAYQTEAARIASGKPVIKVPGQKTVQQSTINRYVDPKSSEEGPTPVTPAGGNGAQSKAQTSGK